MSIKTFLIEKKDLEGGLVHQLVILLIKLSGQGAVRASMASIVAALRLGPEE
ncbi:hypothetical protein BgiBS90_019460, partial [Biomphalaria glabrata]